MTSVSYPGVYIQEVSSGVRPLEVASTSTAAFVGVAEMGPREATRVTSWTRFQRIYGQFLPDSYLAHSVFQYFNNGGRQCYVVRVVGSGARAASVTVQNRAEPPVAGMTFTAKTEGAWGNRLVLQIEDGTANPGTEFKLSARMQSDPNLLPADFNQTPPVEVFDNLSADPQAPRYVETVLANESMLLTARKLATNKFQQGLRRSGDNPTTPLQAKRNLQINLDGDGFQLVKLPDEVATADLAAVAEAIQAAVRLLQKQRASTDVEAFREFTCSVETGAGAGAPKRLVLRSGTTKAASSVRVAPAPDDDASVQLKLAASDGVTEDGVAAARPANDTWVQVGDAEEARVVLDATPGDDGSNTLTATDFANAFPRLDTITDASLLAVPGEAFATVMNAGMAYCAGRPLQDMFFIGETTRADQTPPGAAAFRDGLTGNAYGAVYYPWVKAPDPTGRGSDPVLLPPSGYVAGLYARIDASRGVWKAPAGTEATLNGVVGLGYDLTDIEHGNLNQKGVCVLRRFPSSGVVAFGARTVFGPSAAEWKYIPVRRTAIMLRVSIYNGIQWAVFEPNDETLWSQLRLNISSFMTTLFRQGAFQGSSTAEAFYVKCDDETTTDADIANGIVNVEVGFAPLRPAEFVVVRISQKAGQASS